jgi:nicotinamide-nucleotide amidase
MLGVAPALIRTEGAVSEKVAYAMARGALEDSPAGVAVAVTGIAGPDGGSGEKPVGTVHMAAVTDDGKAIHRVQLFAGDRDAIRLQTAVMALQMVVEILTE